MAETLTVPDSDVPVSGSAGVSTFLITDIEGSTRLWEEQAAAMGPALALHDGLLRTAVEESRGTVIKTTGDGLLAVFADQLGAIQAAVTAQRGLRDADWAETGPLRVRMAIHSGAAESRDGDYFGPSLNRAARILGIGHGGQVILSAVAAVLVRDRLPATLDLLDLGSHRLRDLDRPEQIFQLVAPDLSSSFPPLRSLSTHRSNMPVQVTSFVGREADLAEVKALVGRHHLVTLIGTGGTGKTRLMLEAAAALEDRFADGTWLAELAPLTDASQIASEIARALGTPEVPGRPTTATITAFLADKELLLLLDNAEHLVDGVATVAGRLLAAAPRLRIITTSREALAVSGEAVHQLKSLSCPPMGSQRTGMLTFAPDEFEAAAATEAVRLFSERAMAVDPGFALTPDNVAGVTEICRRLDGIPLAIELAAARVSSMSTDDIALRLGDRFRLLAGGRRTAVPRQQTLQALIDWSWDLLTEDDRRLLRRLSIFAGGWTAGTAAKVVGDGPGTMDQIELLDGLSRLVDRSLVLVDRGPTTRYRMLETIRQYAREKLIESGEVASVADRQFAAFAALAAAAQPELTGPAMVDWLDRMDADAENLGAAMEWGLEAAPWEAVRMARDLLSYWAVRVASADNDARTVAAIEIARAMTVGKPGVDPADQALAAWLLGQAAWLWGASGRAAEAVDWARDAVTLGRASGDESALLFALAGQAVSSVFIGADASIPSLFAEATDLAERSGSWWALSMAAGFSGATLWITDHGAGEALVTKGVDAARRSGNPYAMGAAALAQGRMLGYALRTDEAQASYEVAIARFSEIGDDRFVLAGRSDLAHALRRGGRLDQAAALYRETIGGWVRLGNRGAVANQLENVAFLAVVKGRLDEAARLFGAAEAIREVGGARMSFDETPEYEDHVARLRAALAPADFERLWASGRRLSTAEAVAIVQAPETGQQSWEPR
ncbi:MAG: hypothetical protein HYX54_00640 [Chloroflexi bacterium]|nr:hypothetical protein [Chloroflexota bacterium]